jgi:1-aminocyclopropane-1-carboxylate deaminase/D-cysteine desulfhydrase-like pyridoxal-dependent ACC family enzyme
LNHLAAAVQVPELDVVVVPVSGGGLLSGVAIAVKSLKPQVKVIAAEPCGTNNSADAAASKAAGRLIQDMPKTLTVADGLQGKYFAVAAGWVESMQPLAWGERKRRLSSLFCWDQLRGCVCALRHVQRLHCSPFHLG